MLQSTLTDQFDRFEHSGVSYRHSNVILQEHGNKLWLGDYASAEDVEQLQAKHIRTVVTAAQGYSLEYDRAITHHLFNLQDVKAQNIMQYFDEATRKIAAGLRTGSVLVHCAAGVSRSATLVIAYLIKQHQMTFHQALSHCKKCRPEVCPNISFERQLKLYEKSLGRLAVGRIGETTKRSNMSTTLPEITAFRSNQKERETRRSNFNSTDYGGFKPTMKPKHSAALKQNRGWTTQQRKDAYLRQIAQFRFGITSLVKGKRTTD